MSAWPFHNEAELPQACVPCLAISFHRFSGELYMIFRVDPFSCVTTNSLFVVFEESQICVFDDVIIYPLSCAGSQRVGTHKLTVAIVASESYLQVWLGFGEAGGRRMSLRDFNTHFHLSLASKTAQRVQWSPFSAAVILVLREACRSVTTAQMESCILRSLFVRVVKRSKYAGQVHRKNTSVDWLCGSHHSGM